MAERYQGTPGQRGAGTANRARGLSFVPGSKSLPVLGLHCIPRT